MVKNPSSAKKRVRTQNKGLTAQNKKDLQCILGTCSHTPASKTCLYWSKVVDSDDPAAVQLRLVEKIINKALA